MWIITFLANFNPINVIKISHTNFKRPRIRLPYRMAPAHFLTVTICINHTCKSHPASQQQNKYTLKRFENRKVKNNQCDGLQSQYVTIDSLNEFQNGVSVAIGCTAQLLPRIGQIPLWSLKLNCVSLEKVQFKTANP